MQGVFCCLCSFSFLFFSYSPRCLLLKILLNLTWMFTFAWQLLLSSRPLQGKIGQENAMDGRCIIALDFSFTCACLHTCGCLAHNFRLLVQFVCHSHQGDHDVWAHVNAILDAGWNAQKKDIPPFEAAGLEQIRGMNVERCLVWHWKVLHIDVFLSIMSKRTSTQTSYRQTIATPVIKSFGKKGVLTTLLFLCLYFEMYGYTRVHLSLLLGDQGLATMVSRIQLQGAKFTNHNYVTCTNLLIVLIYATLFCLQLTSCCFKDSFTLHLRDLWVNDSQPA